MLYFEVDNATCCTLRLIMLHAAVSGWLCYRLQYQLRWIKLHAAVSGEHSYMLQFQVNTATCCSFRWTKLHVAVSGEQSYMLQFQVNKATCCSTIQWLKHGVSSAMAPNWCVQLAVLYSTATSARHEFGHGSQMVSAVSSTVQYSDFSTAWV